MIFLKFVELQNSILDISDKEKLERLQEALKADSIYQIHKSSLQTKPMEKNKSFDSSVFSFSDQIYDCFIVTLNTIKKEYEDKKNDAQCTASSSYILNPYMHKELYEKYPAYERIHGIYAAFVCNNLQYFHVFGHPEKKCLICGNEIEAKE